MKKKDQYTPTRFDAYNPAPVFDAAVFGDEEEMYNSATPKFIGSGEDEDALLSDQLKKDQQAQMFAEMAQLDSMPSRQLAQAEPMPRSAQPTTIQTDDLSGNDLITKRQKLLEEFKALKPRSYDEELQAAQDYRDQRAREALFLRGAGTINKALAQGYGGTADDNADFARQYAELGEQAVKNIGEKQSVAKNRASQLGDELKLIESIGMTDPKSRVSELYRKQAKARGLDVPDDASANDIKDLLDKSKAAGSTAAASSRYIPTTIMDETTGKSKVVFVNQLDPSDIVDVGARGYAPRQIKDTRTGEYMEIVPGTDVKKQLTGPKQPEIKEGQKVELTRDMLDANQTKRLDDARKALRSETQAARESLFAVGDIKNMLKTGKDLDADILRAIQNKFARASGEVGVMTEGDVAGFGGSAALQDRIKRTASMLATGKLPESDRKFLSQFAEAMERGAKDKIEKVIYPVVKAFEQDASQADNLSQYNFKESNYRKLLGAEELMGPPPEANEKVMVISPSGKKGLIPKANLKKALEQGYKEMK